MTTDYSHHPRAARHVADVQGLAAGSRAADADEQSRSRRRRASRRSGRLRRHGQGGAQLGGVRRDRRGRSRRSSTTKRCSCSRASRSASSRRIPARRACSSPTPTLVPTWATWENFRDLEDRGLTMYGQMTAGSWIYIGSRRASCRAPTRRWPRSRRRHFGGTLSGRIVVTAGLGGMGGAQPLAVDDERRRRRWSSRSIRSGSSGASRRATSTRATDRPRRGARNGRPLGRATASARSIGLLGNAAEVLPALVARGVTPDVVTDQTSAHDRARSATCPNGLSLAEAARLRDRRSGRVHQRRSIGGDGPRTCAAMLDAAEARRDRVRLRQQHPRAGA